MKRKWYSLGLNNKGHFLLPAIGAVAGTVGKVAAGVGGAVGKVAGTAASSLGKLGGMIAKSAGSMLGGQGTSAATQGIGAATKGATAPVSAMSKIKDVAGKLIGSMGMGGDKQEEQSAAPAPIGGGQVGQGAMPAVTMPTFQNRPSAGSLIAQMLAKRGL